MKVFTDEEWTYFCSKINWGTSFLDARAVRIMNKPRVKSEIIEEIILKHKDCRSRHKCIYENNSNYYLSCLIMILAEIKEENPVELAIKKGFIIK